MSRLIRLDRTGHTELASWTSGDTASGRVPKIDRIFMEVPPGSFAARGKR